MRFVESATYDEDRRACMPLVLGLVVAKVSKRLDDGTYELVYDSIGSGEKSAPARVVMPMAGGGRGVYFMPEEGDEVIVAFEQGDPNLPIVLGAVWNERAQPPDAVRASESGNDVRAIVSRSGHKLVFDDKSGREKITLATQGGHSLELDDMPGAAKVTLKTTGGLTFQLDDVQKSLTIQVPNSITISTTTLSITTTGGISLIANQLLTIDGMPFLAHVHAPPVIPPAGTTGPVKP
jgi:uncharacterized protein involved in type VI secretion and phage assembly